MKWEGVRRGQYDIRRYMYMHTKIKRHMYMNMFICACTYQTYAIQTYMNNQL